MLKLTLFIVVQDYYKSWGRQAICEQISINNRNTAEGRSKRCGVVLAVSESPLTQVQMGRWTLKALRARGIAGCAFVALVLGQHPLGLLTPRVLHKQAGTGVLAKGCVLQLQSAVMLTFPCNAHCVDQSDPLLCNCKKEGRSIQ